MIEHIEESRTGGGRDIHPRDERRRGVQQKVPRQDGGGFSPQGGTGVADAPALRVGGEGACEIRPSPAHQVAVDHIVVQEEGRVQQFEGERRVEGGVLIRASKGLERAQDEARADALPAFRRVARAGPEPEVIAPVAFRRGDAS